MAGKIAGPGMVADPRENAVAYGEAIGEVPNNSYANRILATIHDPRVSFEEYLYYAKISRADEKRLFGPGSNWQETKGPVARFFSEKILRQEVKTRETPVARVSVSNPSGVGNEKLGFGSDKSSSPDRFQPMEITDEEWVTASRAARTASWSAVFYLITTDILGPFSTGWAFSQLGWGPAVSLYTVFGALSGYTGYQIWRIFIQMDSDRYPMKDFGDLGFRVFGQWARHIANILQSFQFFFNVGLIIITSGQSISQMSKAKLCFVICVLVSAISGCLIGQIRTLARFGWLASLAVFMNLFVIFSTMGVMAHSTPNYTAVAATSPLLLPDPTNPAPITTRANLPAGLGLVNNINGLMQAVFSFGGATLFMNLLSEMRRPFDFWKALLIGETFIYVVYLVYGAYVYGMQGQYAYNPAYQGIDPYGWQTVGNTFGLITGIIAACLYGNIGIKVLYNNVGRDLLKFPLLETKRGKWLFMVLVPLYWTLAFIVAAAIPQVSNFSGFVAALCIMQFTYTFPPILMVAFKCQRDAILPEEAFDPSTGTVQRKDKGFSRWMRGFKKELLWNTWDTFFFLGSCVVAVLGLYACLYLMHEAYSTNPNQSGFSCNSPVGG